MDKGNIHKQKGKSLDNIDEPEELNPVENMPSTSTNNTKRNYMSEDTPSEESSDEEVKSACKRKKSVNKRPWGETQKNAVLHDTPEVDSAEYSDEEGKTARKRKKIVKKIHGPRRRRTLSFDI